MARASLLSHIDSFPLMESYDLCVYLREKEIEDKLFLRWSIGFQTEMSFEEFKEACRPVPIKSEKAIKDEVRELFS